VDVDVEVVSGAVVGSVVDGSEVVDAVVGHTPPRHCECHAF
jgi:hypothetical protein